MNNKKMSKGLHSGSVNEKNINYLNTLINKASEAFNEENYEVALKYYNKAISIDQENHVLYSNKSAILLKLGKVKEAIEEAEYAINLQPSWPKAYFRKSEALKSIGRYIDAILVLANGLQAHPDCDEILQFLIQTALLAPDLSKTFINIFEEIKKLNLEKSSFVIISVIGQELLTLDYLPEAIYLLKIAISIDVDSVKLKESVYGAMAKAYYKMKDHSKACECMEVQINLNEALGDSGTLIELLKKYSQLCYKVNYYDKAIDSIRRAIDLQKELGINWKDSFIILADMYTKLEEWEKLESLSEDVLEENDGEGEIYWILGKMFINIKEWEKGEECFRYGLQHMKGTIEKVLCECYILKCRVQRLLLTYQLPLSIKDKLKEIENKIYSINDVEVCEVFNILFEISYHLKEIKLCKMYVHLQLKFALEYQLKSKYYLIIGLGNLSKFYLLVNDISAAVKIGEKRIEIILEEECKHINRDGKSKSFNNNKMILQNFVKLEVFSSTESAMKYHEGKRGSEERFELLKKILSISKSENHIKWIVKYLTKLIKFCKKYHKIDIIDEYMNELKGFVNIHNKYEWILLKIEGYLFEEDKQSSEAIKKYEECLMIVQENENVRDEIKLCIKLALMYEKRSEFEECLVYLEQGLIISKQCKNIKKMIFLYGKIGEINQALRRYGEAVEAFKRYLTLTEIFNLEKEVMEGYIMLSEIYISLKEYHIALNVLIEVEKKIDNEKYKKEKAIVYGLLGKVYQLLDKKKSAMGCFCKQMGYLNYVNNYEDMLKCLGFLIFEKKENGDVEWCVKLIEMRKQLSKKIGIISKINVLKDDSKILSEIGKINEAKEWLEEAILSSLQINYDFDSIVEMIIEIVEIFDLIDENEKAIELLNTITKIEAFSNSTPVMIMKGELASDINDKKKIYNKIIDNGFWNESVVWKMVQLYWYDDNQMWIYEYSQMSPEDNTFILHILQLLKELQKNYNNINNKLLYKIENILNNDLGEEEMNLLCEGFLYLNIYPHINKCKMKSKGWMEIYFEIINQNWKTLESLILSLKKESNSLILESVIVNTLSNNQTNIPSSFEMISNTINQNYLWNAMKRQLKCHDKKEVEDSLNKYFIKKKKYNYYNSGLWNFDGEWFREMLVIWKILQKYNENNYNTIKLIGMCEVCQRNIKLQEWEDVVKKTSFLNIIFVKKVKNEEIKIYIEMSRKNFEIIKHNGIPLFYIDILYNYLEEKINIGQVLKWDNNYYNCSTFINYPIKGNMTNYIKIFVDCYESFENKNISIMWLGKSNKIGLFLDEPNKNIDVVKKLINNCCDLYFDNNILDINLLDNLQYLDTLLIKTNKVISKKIIEKCNRTIIFDNDVDEGDILQFYTTKVLPSILANKVYIYGDIIKDNCHYQMSIDLTKKFVSISNNMDEVIKLLKQTTVEPRLKLKELTQSFDLQNKYKRKSRRRGKERGSKLLYSARNSFSFDDNNTENGMKSYCSEGDERKSVLSNTFSQISMTLSEKDLEEIEGESGAKIMSIDMEFDGNFNFYESSKEYSRIDSR
uniref:MalT-like TPR region domain-containing protein n=1 Tax=Strongyloides stercoralis TaxID=6248 RepID=A0AAF5DBT4_STRER